MIEVHGAGPIYWGREHPVGIDILPDQRRVTYSWMVEDQEPYRASVWGFRLRFTETYAIHVGVCKKAEEPPHKQLAQVSPSDIGAWGRQQKAEGGGLPEEAAKDSG
jgi:hypothetical protein